MKIAVIGAGAMGCLYGGRLFEAGYPVILFDRWDEHVSEIGRRGLLLDGIEGSKTIAITATSDPSTISGIDLAIIFVDTNSTAAAAQSVLPMLASEGAVITLQNGIGNLEALDAVLGAERVMGGLSYFSAALAGLAHATHTHTGPTWVGPRSGLPENAHLAPFIAALEKAGLAPTPVPDIQMTIWEKWILNCSINAVSAITGLRQGEIPRTPSAEEFQDRILDEALAVVAALRLPLPPDEIREKIKAQCWKKFNKPSMLQHIEAGKRTEIDALNGAVVREARRLGFDAPYNDALTLMIKGLETSRRQKLHEKSIDYDRMEEEAAQTPRPHKSAFGFVSDRASSSMG